MSLRVRRNEENLPKKRLVSRQRPGPNGTVITYYEEVDFTPDIGEIHGVRPPAKDIEQTVKPIPSKHTLENHREVDPQEWGKFNQPGPKKIYGDRPREVLIPRLGEGTGPLAGRTIPTRSELETESSLLRRVLRRLSGDDKK